MHTKLIHIGNSMGIRIPKNLIRQFNLDKGEIELTIEKDGILIKPEKSVPRREEWDMLFSKAIAAGEKPENDVFEGLQNSTDKNEWEWQQ
ncbi:AbrB/MazE/SpoVT family DNA-binding domain-containing protein [Chitinophaga sp. XS-30]|uniref:AbrB/MazE/SpoVT family DNA-binding domain-containing protein n=1 Tax=Chitinophaga sp. XS-30 TaxID=2604421 RepID=UPI0011DE37AC|nr:AbrB/MazE/SpoVT family DNA-binding domain-containing protein [Chitinophaga sp. XS-30]QEH41691.1 AbrB/MazE/SpoVT family DNA-binding domain-containing protein [Chitinophaga sp. XS-30]